MSEPTLSPGPLNIEVWSDVVCPWCYIGKRRLESALTQIGGEDIPVVWRAFQLDPSAPRPGEPGHGQGVAEHLGHKYGGGLAAGQAMSEQMTQVAAEEGLDFHLEDAGRGNTVDAHRLLHLAAELESKGSAGLQDRVKERFLLAYFTQGHDISDPAVLQTLATEAGLPAARVEGVLAADDYAHDVAAEQAQAQAYGASGVPFTVIDGRYGVSGAQPVEVFVDAIRRAQADRAPQLVPVTAGASEQAAGASGQAAGEACGPDGCAVPPQ
ncbi:MAG: DsbA family oxidoreductase [Ornithinimicrobium sp.]|uniref:DsbA family oxidoreductase n=1 Tax=Ornithinimicrobium sp. TaxID=1977084 RepID=UPI003D9AF46E